MKRSIVRAAVFTAFVSASLALLMSCVGIVSARPGRLQQPSQDESQLARNAISRTNEVLRYAQDSVRMKRHYTGDLASAYSNQRYAHELYNRGEYHYAIEHTLYARRLAYRAIDANGSRYGRSRYDDESRFHSRSDRQLRDDTRRFYPEGPADDEAVLSFVFQFDI